MAQLLVTYRTPADAKAFDNYYFETHVPLVKKIPGLRKLVLSDGPVGTPAGASGVHLIAELHFDDVAALQAGLGSAEGQAAAADAASFMGEGDSLLFFGIREV